MGVKDRGVYKYWFQNMSEWVRDNAPSGNNKCCKFSEKEINYKRIWMAFYGLK